MSLPSIKLLSADDWHDYELLDSGEGSKLERFGPYIFVRPEHQAVWSRKLNNERWNSAHAIFQATAGEETGGKWHVRREVPETWPMRYKQIKFSAHFTNSRHLGVFPEQAVHWDWITERIRQANRPVRVLNLFGYTGAASLAAAAAGAQVTHVDAAKKSVTWAHENLVLSGLDRQSIRWIVDDALKFVEREAKRGSFYDGIILDPPKFGRGPQGEVWEFFDLLPRLLQSCKSLMQPNPLFLALTAYAIRASALSLYFLMDDLFKNQQGNTDCGELVIQETNRQRVISLAIFARWSAELNN